MGSRRAYAAFTSRTTKSLRRWLEWIGFSVQAFDYRVDVVDQLPDGFLRRPVIRISFIQIVGDLNQPHTCQPITIVLVRWLANSTVIVQ